MPVYREPDKTLKLLSGKPKNWRKKSVLGAIKFTDKVVFLFFFAKMYSEDKESSILSGVSGTPARAGTYLDTLNS